jgi:predicted nucleotidyltransferase component of viral defense system
MPPAELKIINPGLTSNIASLYKVYSLEELFFQKIDAFLNRDEGKDIYDIYNILKIKKINMNKKVEIKLKEIINDPLKIKYYNNSTNHFILKRNRIDFKIICEEIIKNHF